MSFIKQRPVHAWSNRTEAMARMVFILLDGRFAAELSDGQGSIGMKLATLKNGSRDGQLVVVSRDLAWALDASSVALTFRQAIENWSLIEPRLQALSVS